MSNYRHPGSGRAWWRASARTPRTGRAQRCSGGGELRDSWLMPLALPCGLGGLAERGVVVQEITALQHAMASRSANPAIYVRQPKLADGSISDMPVLTNLFASRELSARALGIDDHRRSASALAELSSRAIDPVVVAEDDAPVREVIAVGGDANLLTLPALRQHEGDAGHYVTCGHVVTYDPVTGIDNMGIQRLWVRSERLMGCYMLETSHNMVNLHKFWTKGEPCPVAIWVGHHPAVEMGAQSKLGYPESHWGVAGGALGEALRLVPSVTHGEKIMVPADAEIGGSLKEVKGARTQI